MVLPGGSLGLGDPGCCKKCSVLLQDTEEQLVQCKIISTGSSPGCRTVQDYLSVKFFYKDFWSPREYKCPVARRVSSGYCTQSTVES